MFETTFETTLETTFETPPARRHSPAPAETAPAELRLTLVEADFSCRLRRPLVIGRGADCDLRIDDARVGRRHVEIYPVGGQWWVRDLGSDDGTFLREEIVEAEPLSTPAVVRLGPDGPTLRLDGPGDG